ncbi:hypothetical protein E8E13_011259 [Curvularia kusanoi]|uniref:Uncharacterized protein n=1 Tax=Curvularia kusanoi TaxID=90978 RepID=A0A9P4WB73_CURKU|nr:hypothetical protein E8E13_011259 [Curvularia kusanoi]
MPPKRRSEDQNNSTGPPSKKAKIVETSDSEEVEDADPRNGDKIWEILDGNSRDPFHVGVVAPGRLIIRLRNRLTDERRELDLTRNKKTGRAKTIDWDSQVAINDLNTRRSEFFTRMNFPALRVQNRWSKHELAFLTLILEKIKSAVEQDAAICIPSQIDIYDLFTAHFGQDRLKTNVLSRLGRADGKRNDILRGRLYGVKADLLPTGGPKYEPVITTDELEAYINYGYVSINFDPTEYEAVLAGEGLVNEVTPEPEMPVGDKVMSKTKIESKQKKQSGNTKTNAVTRSQSRGTSTQWAKKNAEAVVAIPSPPASPYVHDLRNRPRERWPEAPLSDVRHEPELDQGSEISWAESHDEMSDINELAKGPVEAYDASIAQKNWLSTVLTDGSPVQEAVFVRPQLNSGVPTTPVVMVNGWTQTGPSWTPQDADLLMQDPPEPFFRNEQISAPEPSIRSDTESYFADDDRTTTPGSPAIDVWVNETIIGLKRRIARHAGENDLANAPNSDSQSGIRALWHQDRLHSHSRRPRGAADVNALLNAAIVPPVGYRGDMRSLFNAGELPEDQQLLQEASDFAMQEYHEAHDREWQEKFGNLEIEAGQDDVEMEGSG